MEQVEELGVSIGDGRRAGLRDALHGPVEFQRLRGGGQHGGFRRIPGLGGGLRGGYGRLGGFRDAVAAAGTGQRAAIRQDGFSAAQPDGARGPVYGVADPEGHVGVAVLGKGRHARPGEVEIGVMGGGDRIAGHGAGELAGSVGASRDDGIAVDGARELGGGAPSTAATTAGSGRGFVRACDPSQANRINATEEHTASMRQTRRYPRARRWRLRNGDLFCKIQPANGYSHGAGSRPNRSMGAILGLFGVLEGKRYHPAGGARIAPRPRS